MYRTDGLKLELNQTITYLEIINESQGHGVVKGQYKYGSLIENRANISPFL